jgi:aminomethyltransferase
MNHLKRTAIYDRHIGLGAKMVPFAGWEMPIQYSGVMDEHITCRTKAAIFDVSHMGEIFVTGPEAEQFCQYAITNDLTPSIKSGRKRCVYSPLCNTDGGTVDDLIVYPLSPEETLLVVNGSRTEAALQHLLMLQQQRPWRIEIEDRSHAWSQIAIQGPLAISISIDAGIDPIVQQLKSFEFIKVESPLAPGSSWLVSRTGYTGEDGLEIYTPWEEGGSTAINALGCAAFPRGKAPGAGFCIPVRLPHIRHLIGRHVHHKECGKPLNDVRNTFGGPRPPQNSI